MANVEGGNWEFWSGVNGAVVYCASSHGQKTEGKSQCQGCFSLYVGLCYSCNLVSGQCMVLGEK